MKVSKQNLPARARIVWTTVFSLYRTIRLWFIPGAWSSRKKLKTTVGVKIKMGSWPTSRIMNFHTVWILCGMVWQNFCCRMRSALTKNNTLVTKSLENRVFSGFCLYYAIERGEKGAERNWKRIEPDFKFYAVRVQSQNEQQRISWTGNHALEGFAGTDHAD